MSGPHGALATAPVPGHGPVDSLLEVRDLWKVYGPRAADVPRDPALRALSRRELREQRGCTAAVRAVDLQVGRGEVFVVMGLSGSGKSTLLRCLTRLVEPTSGSVLYDGEDVLAADPKRLRELRRHSFSTVFQHFGLLPHRRVLENVSYGLEVAGVPRAKRAARAREVIELVGLDGYEGSYPDQLSGGMQQRVGLARALAGEPAVLFFDEPFSALDPLTRRDMQDEVVRLHQEVGTTMVFVTHDLREALRVGQRILLLRDGEAVQCGRPDELVGAPADDHVRDFVRDVPPADVLTLRWLARPARPGEPMDGPVMSPDTIVRDATRAVLAADRPVKVVSGQRLLGVVGSADILRIVASGES